MPQQVVEMGEFISASMLQQLRRLFDEETEKEKRIKRKRGKDEEECDGRDEREKREIDGGGNVGLGRLGLIWR